MNLIRQNVEALLREDAAFAAAYKIRRERESVWCGGRAKAEIRQKNISNNLDETTQTNQEDIDECAAEEFTDGFGLQCNRTQTFFIMCIYIYIYIYIWLSVYI